MKGLDDELRLNLFSVESAGKSRGGVNVPIIKITGTEKSKKQKPVIVVMSRQHPGETHPSFVVHGLINYLLTKDYTANKLRKEFEWWIFPCVNPDGVIIGNYYGNTQGKDMNKNFFSSSDTSIKDEDRCPEVELIRTYLQQNLPEDPINFRMFLDMQGNSSRGSISAQAPLDSDEKIANYIKEFT